MKFFSIYLAIPAAIAVSGIPPIYADDAGSKLADQFLSEVLTSNPGVESSRLEWEAMAELPEVVASLPDPMVSYGYYFTPEQTLTGPMRQQFSASQTIPFPGKLGTAKARSAAGAQVAYWRFRAALRDVFAQGRTLLADLYRADGALDVLREQESILRQMAESAKALVKTDQGTLANVIRADVAAEDLATRIAQIDADRSGVVARMAALRGESEPGPAMARYSHPRLPDLPPLDALMARSMVANQDLEAARSAVARDDLAIRAAALEYFPDVTLGIETETNTAFPILPNNGDDPVIGTISINVPIWWGKLGAQKRSAVARRGSSAARQAQLTADVSANVQAAYALARSLREQRDRFAGEIIPGAEQACQSVISSYSAGAASLTDLLDVQRAYLGAQFGLIERTAGYLRAVAELERAIGEPLDTAAAPSDKTKNNHSTR